MIIEDSSQTSDIDIRKNLIQHYRPDAERLVPYISWLEKKHSGDVMNSYEGEGVEKTTFTFPVYDSTLLAFVKIARGTAFITRNYQYVYNRNRIRGVAQEKKAIQSATLQDMELLSGIFSRYVLGGMTKGALWAEAVENGVFLEVLYKLQELLGI